MSYGYEASDRFVSLGLRREYEFELLPVIADLLSGSFDSCRYGFQEGVFFLCDLVEFGQVYVYDYIQKSLIADLEGYLQGLEAVFVSEAESSGKSSASSGKSEGKSSGVSSGKSDCESSGAS